MNSIAILGLGLMGGSLGLALRKAGFPGRITGYARKPQARDEAMRRRMVDEAFDDPQRAVADADLIVLCVPVLSIPGLVDQIKAGLKKGSLLTDVGSTKAEVIEKVEGVLKGIPAAFVGSHPIAGSERQGLDAAREDLYRDAVVLVTADSKAPEAEQVAEFWRHVGARVRFMSATEHDRIMARTSHLPHVAAAGLAATVGRDNGSVDLGAYCGTGFRDATRIAEGSPQIWMDVLQTNRAFLLDELEAFQARLDELLHSLRAGDMERVRRFLENGQDARRRLIARMSAEEGMSNT